MVRYFRFAQAQALDFRRKQYQEHVLLDNKVSPLLFMTALLCGALVAQYLAGCLEADEQNL